MNGWRGFWIVLFGTLLLAGAYFTIMYSQGYHLQWSAKNMRMIWVDENGQP